MFKEIPYFKNGKIKRIIPKDGNYYIERYSGRKNVITSCPINERNRNKLQEEYLKTIEEYLNFDKDKYMACKQKNIKLDKKNYKKTIVLQLLGVLGIAVPLIGIVIQSCIIICIGIFLMLLGAGVFHRNKDNLKEYNNNVVRSKFIENYEMLQFELSYNRVMKRKSTLTSPSIKATINPIYGSNLSKTKKKN